MQFTIPELLSAAAVVELRDRLQEIGLVDGKTTAGWHAKAVKQNQQLDAAQAKPLGQEVRQVLLGHPLFQAGALPRQIRRCASTGIAMGCRMVAIRIMR